MLNQILPLANAKKSGFFFFLGISASHDVIVWSPYLCKSALLRIFADVGQSNSFCSYLQHAVHRVSASMSYTFDVPA